MLKMKNVVDELGYWQQHRSTTNQYDSSMIDDDDDDQRSLALSLSLLRKPFNSDIPTSLVPLSCHTNNSTTCQCRRSFHLFCTDLFAEDREELQMINIHPAPRQRDRDIRRLILRSARKYRRRGMNDQDPLATARSEPVQLTLAENQALEKKLPIPLRLTTRTTSLNVPPPSNSNLPTAASLPYHRPFPLSIKPSPALRNVRQSNSFVHLQIRAQSVFDQSSNTFQAFIPKGPPPSPKTPTLDPSILIPSSSSFSINPIRAISIIPKMKYQIDSETPTGKGASSYHDHAREYLSASDCSDDENQDEAQKIITKPKEASAQTKKPQRTRSLSRTDTTTRDRVLFQNPNHYLSLAEVYYSSLDVYRNITDKARRRQQLPTRTVTVMQTRDADETSTTTSKTMNTIKTCPVPQAKSVFGFSKTASSMHFGHAAGRLGLQSSFEKWPQPVSRRTPIERKQAVTTLRLVTLPLVTS